MTSKETAQIIAIMQVNYPDSFRGKTDDTLRATIKLWTQMFSDEKAENVMAAVMAHMAVDTSRFMPPVGVIKDRLTKLRTPNEMTEQEAWGYVSRALRNGIYGYREEFDKLPEIVQRIVGSPIQIKEWAMMDADTLQSVVASNFQRSYKVRSKSERETMALPPCVRAVVAQLAEPMKQKMIEE